MELLDIYDDNGNITGKTIVRGDKTVKLSPNEHIAVGVIFIENDKGEFLIQKTSPEKGGEFGTTGGHIDAGETPLASIKREVKEELGINIDQDQIQEYGYFLFDMPIRFLFYLRKNIELKDITVQKEEVEWVKYMTIAEIEELIETNQMLKSHALLLKELMNIKNSKEG